MSVINKMLQELDRREAMAGEGPLPPKQVKAVKPAGGHEWFWRAVAALMLCAVAWTAWVAYQLRPAPGVATQLAFKAAEEARTRTGVVKPAPKAVAKAPPPPAPAAAPAAPPAPAAAPPAQAQAPAPAPAKPAAETMRLATIIETPIVEKAPKPAPASKPAAEPSKAPPAAKRPDQKPVAAASASPTPAIPPAGSPVERRERVTTPHERAEREFRRAVDLLKQGRGPEAEEGFAAALVHEPAHRAARQALVALSLERGQLENARRLLSEGLAINPGQPEFAVALARILIERKDYSGALLALQGPSLMAPNHSELNLMRATVLQRMGRHSEAADAYRSSLQLQASSPHGWIGLGISLEALKQRPEAAEAFRRALSAGPVSDELKTFAEQRLRALR